MKVFRPFSLSLAAAGILTVVAGSLASCNGGSGSFGGSGSGSGDAERDESSGDSEDETGDVPQEVTGSFLTCAFMESRNVVTTRIEHNTAGYTGIACGVFKPENGEVHIAAISNLEMRVRLLMGERDYRMLEHKRLRDGSPMHLVTQVPNLHLGGTLQIDLRSETSSWVAFRKSIPTIQAFDVARGFSIDDYMKEEGISLTDDDGSWVVESSGGTSSEDNWFFKYVAPVLIAVYGDEAGHQASYDNGTTVLQGQQAKATKGYCEDPYRYDQVTRYPQKTGYDYGKPNGGYGGSSYGGGGYVSTKPTEPASPPAPTPSEPAPGPNPDPAPGPVQGPAPEPTGPAPGSTTESPV